VTVPVAVRIGELYYLLFWQIQDFNCDALQVYFLNSAIAQDGAERLAIMIFGILPGAERSGNTKRKIPCSSG
jgi:hypothetical protein